MQCTAHYWQPNDFSNISLLQLKYEFKPVFEKMSGESENGQVEFDIDVGNVNHGYCPETELSQLDGHQGINEESKSAQVKTDQSSAKDELLHTDKG